MPALRPVRPAAGAVARNPVPVGVPLGFAGDRLSEPAGFVAVPAEGLTLVAVVAVTDLLGALRATYSVAFHRALSARTPAAGRQA